MASSCWVIENKIKSGINGLSEDKRHSQLDAYVKEISKEYPLEHIYGFVLCPNYHKIKLSNYKNAYNQQFIARYYTGNEENVINYDALTKFFTKVCIYYVEDPYFKDFLKALKLHSGNHDTFLEDLMRERFFAMTTNNNQ